MTRLEARPRVNRQALHPSITAEQIDRLVDEFYTEVRRNTRLSPIFDANMSGDWDSHLEKMKAFWRSVLLKSGEYKGQPVPVHLKIKEVTSQDFEEWLWLFSATANRVFHGQAAELVIEAARRIATSLWLSRSTDPFASPPAWSKPRGSENIQLSC